MKDDFKILRNKIEIEFDKMRHICVSVRVNGMFSVHSGRSNLDVSRKNATFAAILQN